MQENIIKEKLSEIFKDDYEKVHEFIIFYTLIKRFGSSFVEKIYSGDVFNYKINFLEKLDIIPDFEEIDFQNSNKHFNNLNSINIEWIRYFVILCETGNFDVAAYKLNISVRTLQKAVSGLESSLKVKLIYGKNIYKGLTYAGNLFLDKSRYILQNFHDLNKNINNLKTEKEIVRINLAWINLYWLNTLSDTISKLKENFPQIYFKVHFMSNSDIEKWVENGEIDIALIVSKPSLKSIERVECKKYPYVVVGKPQEKKDWKDLRYLMPSTDFQEGPAWFRKIIGDKIISEMDLSMVLDMCEKGLGASFVPLATVENRIKQGSLSVIADPPVEHYDTPYIIYNKNISMNKVISAFIDEIKELI